MKEGDITQDRQQPLACLAEKLSAAWRDKAIIDQPQASELPMNRAEAYFVQDQMAKSIGLGLAGWKVGATSSRMRELDGHDDVIPGRIFESVCWQGTQMSLDAKRFPGARAETEFAFRLLRDLPIRSKPWTADDLVDGLSFHPAVEIIGNRHSLPEAPASIRSLMTIADNGGGIGFVFGDAVEHCQNVDFKKHIIDLRVDGGPAAENFLGDMRCQPVQAVADLANHLNQRGFELFAGDFVSTGAATVPQPIQLGSHLVADFGVLGSISLTFE